MNPANVALLVSKGMSFVCAACKKHWQASDRGLDGCMARVKKKPCAGPLKGKSFPEYEGPLQDHLSKCCFVCGKEPDALVLTEDGGAVGVCNEHMSVLESFSEGRDAPPFITKVKAHSLKK